MEAEANLIRGIQAAAQLEDQINAVESVKRANAAHPSTAASTMVTPTTTAMQAHGDAGLEESQHSATLVSNKEDYAADPNYESNEEVYYDSDSNSYGEIIDCSEPTHVRMARLEKELAELRGTATPSPSVKGKGVDAKISPKKKFDLRAEIMAKRRSKDQSSIEIASESARHSKKQANEESSANAKGKVARTGSPKDASVAPTHPALRTSPLPAVGKPHAASKLISPAWVHAATKLASLNSVQGGGSCSMEGKQGGSSRATTLMLVQIQPIPTTPIGLDTSTRSPSTAAGVLGAIIATGSRGQPTMADLPIRAQDIFKSDFLLSYFDFLGSRTRPFDMSENCLVVEQQFIWDTFLESFPVKIIPLSGLHPEHLRTP
ncbi:hypothetical protein BOTBODRAFT_176945 [Botryobasidium botryosum FD-172 SS1]|uniref:Uncharacterized protein n=1 Tax=Botryobasidium botryosum (strain FD-172 SS1) TaxID=930990 RepID=A0A067MIP3_BOTB1|nr:hypothetical protein BOTBODRAFT_176945 [Botryobasidium botryosum FD-172 SS1]